jgi:hypothetical protein
MNLFQFRRRQSSQLIPLILDDLIVEFEFFQQPENPLGAGVIEVVNLQHRAPFL